jgi:hypothetical protein
LEFKLRVSPLKKKLFELCKSSDGTIGEVYNVNDNVSNNNEDDADMASVPSIALTAVEREHKSYGIFIYMCIFYLYIYIYVYIYIYKYI